MLHKLKIAYVLRGPGVLYFLQDLYVLLGEAKFSIEEGSEVAKLVDLILLDCDDSCSNILYSFLATQRSAPEME